MANLPAIDAIPTSLLLVCAHAWEARPFLDSLQLKASPDSFPFPCYVNGEVALLLTGSGPRRAAIAVAGWLGRRLVHQPGSGLAAPPLVVANFGTAGAYEKRWKVGQTAVIAKVRDGMGESLYPERLVAWSGPEAECRTVATPQREILTEDGARRPLFDMEAFGVAEAVTTFLSSSHLVIGKCVLDEIGPDGDTLDVAALTARCQDDYESGALAFLEHAQRHRALLAGDPRREKTERVPGAVERYLQALRTKLPLTVSQQRELARAVSGQLAACGGAEELEGKLEALLACAPTEPLTDKTAVKKALARLLEQLHSQGV